MTVVVIEWDDPDDGWVEIQDDVLFSSAAFESQLAAIPGMFEITVKDMLQAYNFLTGRELRLKLDGDIRWGGFITQFDMFYALIVDTNVPADVVVRQWKLRGVDYNILFDKRVVANYANPTHEIPQAPVDTQDGEAVLALMDDYLVDVSDIGTSLVEDTGSITPDGVKSVYGVAAEKWRESMQRISNVTGSIWYITPEKELVHKQRETDGPVWGFSDKPNGSTTFGAREIRYTLDGSSIVNDALLWGGSGFDEGQVRYARTQNTYSIGDGMRVQYGATHFNQKGYFKTASLAIHGQIIVSGAPGAVAVPFEGIDAERGLQHPLRQLTLSWFDHMVPSALIPGQVITTYLYVWGSIGDPLEITLPLRSVRITFPSPTIVRLDGMFGIQTTDPYSLWAYLKKEATRAGSTPISSLSDTATVPIAGAWFTDTGFSPDGVEDTFALRFPFLSSSTRAYVAGLLVSRSTYTEDPEAGTITFNTPPANGVTLQIMAQCSGL